MHFILTYHTVNRFNDRKMRYRSDHLDLVRSYYRDGLLVMGGALLEPNDAALLIFLCDHVDEVEGFVEKDPYVQKGLVKSYDIRPWSVVIGGDSMKNDEEE